MKNKLKYWKKYLMLMGMSLLLTSCKKEEKLQKIIVEKNPEIVTPVNNRIISYKTMEKEITISAVGDCTLGTDTHFGYPNSFTNILDNINRDFSYFFASVYDIVSKMI